tara:strand:+ start:777 stop:1400 length:624 start_codon:yes stop_codon:yes gene_type:complete
MKVMTLKKNGHVVIEEVPTNSASSGAIAGLPPDEPPVRKKRKNKMGIDIFQRIRNSRLKEETMEDQTVIKEYSSENSGSNEVSSAMRMIQQKRKLQKKQEREKRAANRKQEIQALSKAKAKDYAKKASDRQKKVAKDVSKVEKTNKKESFDWQGTFNQLNEQFATLSQEQQEKFLKTWLQMSEENQNKFTSLISENFEKANQFVETL